MSLNCKEKKREISPSVKEFSPHFEFASFIDELTRLCTVEHSQELELKNPGFSQIIEASQFIQPTEKEYPTLSSATRLSINSERRNVQHGTVIYFIRDNNTISFQINSKDIDCSFPYQGPKLGETIAVRNLAPKYKQDRD